MRQATYTVTAFLRADRPCRSTAEVARMLGVSEDAVRGARYRFRNQGVKVPVRRAGAPVKKRRAK